MAEKNIEPYNTVIREIVRGEKESDVKINNKYILDVYNGLSDEERVNLIRAIYKCNINKEINNIEELNTLEMIKLKTWAIKTTAITILVALIIFIVFYFLLSDNFFSGNNHNLNTLQQIYNAIFSN